jgi:uncharacterized protein DUF1553/uncharacterized protein DUF1549
MRRHVALIAVASGLTLIASDAVAPLGVYSPAERRHWAFRPRSKPTVPAFTAPADRQWVKTPIDAFILQQLQKEELKPSPEADRTTLIRRVYYDLTGLPPTPAEISAFVANRDPDSYTKLVDRLLESPHYGERWAQHWLDVVRFGESEGFEYDTHLKDAWRFRDYVIRSVQNDKPFDRFVIEQIAGDELKSNNDEALVAAGFNRFGPVRRNAGNQEVASSRNEVLTEMTNIIGAAFMGVTLGCARCHDHKFDPIRQSDYYRIQAYFSSVHGVDVPRATPDEVAAWKAKAEPVEAEIKELRASMQKLRGMPNAADQREQFQKKLEMAQEKMPEPLPSIHTVAANPAEKSPIHLLARGDYLNKGDRVGMRPLGVLLLDGTPELPENTEQPRLSLARWIVDPQNPLTARVAVNRIWQYHFGRGIVGTPNDFGRMGEPPTNPELLDFLANEFVGSGWSFKHMHRMILNSSAYRQTSALPSDPALRAASLEKDPDNKLLWRANRKRLEAEAIRDSVLAVSGRLNFKQGGPSILVPVEEELVNALYKPSQWAVTKDAAEHRRRSVYLMNKRNVRLPFLEVFDQPNSLVSCPRRESSTHAPQALELLNGDLTNTEAKHFAARLKKEAGDDPKQQVILAYKLATGRGPNAKQLSRSVEFLKTRPLEGFTLAMFNLNAFLYVD